MRSDTAERILDAAECRLRSSGYNGFSFRDLAEDVGVRSASVHHHFATKEALVSALVRRHRERLMADLQPAPAGPARVAAYRAAFRKSVEADLGMCLCGMLGAEALGLPPAVRREARAFFGGLVDHLADGLSGHAGDPRREALSYLATLEGAMILARAFGDIAAYDEATGHLAAPTG